MKNTKIITLPTPNENGIGTINANSTEFASNKQLKIIYHGNHKN